MSKRRTLLDLSHDLGAEPRQLAILGEGNASAKLSDHTFLVKASGSSLGALREDELVECRFDVLLPLLDLSSATYEAIDETLFGCRIHTEAKKPSSEALFHALLLSLPGIHYVGHTHPVAVNAILCSPLGETFAEQRMCPDEVVCCGEASVFVPYCDPGLRLAQTIRERTNRYIERFGTLPRVILLQNHGLITLGATAAAVVAATLMTVKAAKIFAGASALGGPNFLSHDQIDSIANRRDEHYRQKALNL